MSVLRARLLSRVNVLLATSVAPILFSTTSLAQNKLPKVGSVAPPLHLQSILNAPAGTKLELPTGKTVVVEFWATWCAPCLGQFPAIRALVHDADPSKVAFISVTDEDPGKIQRFLKTHPLAGSIGIDTTGDVFNRYGVATRPATVVIGPDGKVVTTTLHPDQLSAGQLMKIASGAAKTATATHNAALAAQVSKANNDAQKEMLGNAGAEDGVADLFHISISKAKQQEGQDPPMHLFRFDGRSLILLDAHLKDLIVYALDLPESRVSVDKATFAKQRYNLSIQVPSVPAAQLNSALELAISSGLGVTLEHHQAEESVLVLRQLHPERAAAPDNPTKPAKFHLAYFDEKKGQFTLMSAMPKDIAPAVEGVLGRAVVAEDGGAIACSTTFAGSSDRAAVQASLEKLCGLTLEDGRRTIDRLTVIPATRP